MANTTKWISGSEPSDLLTKRETDIERSPAEVAREDDSDGESYSTGILPSQVLEQLVKVSKEIVSVEPIQDDQFQPASHCTVSHVCSSV